MTVQALYYKVTRKFVHVLSGLFKSLFFKQNFVIPAILIVIQFQHVSSYFMQLVVVNYTFVIVVSCVKVDGI